MEITFETLEKCAAHLYWRALRILPPDVNEMLTRARGCEEEGAGEVLGSMIENARLAAASRDQIICQDTGIPVILLELGEGCRLTCDPVEALSSGIAEATARHSLRANCVNVISRENTGTNRGNRYPVVHLLPGGGEGARVTLLAKGSGSESRSRLEMLNPVSGLEGARHFVLKTVARGAAMSCPPIVVGVGLGGSFDSVALLAKVALARPLGVSSHDPTLRDLETALLKDLNSLGIGPMGLGGRTTALWVSIESADTHLTLNPVAVNLSCWAHRRSSARLVEGGYEVEDR